MRLLSKTQTAVDTSLIKKQQIDEGVSIAKKIDAMRQELSGMQKQRGDFIEGTKSAIEQETKTAREEMVRLGLLIRSLKAQREALEEPLDKEWEQVKEARKKLSEEQEILKQGFVDLNATKVLSDAKVVALEDKDKRLELIQGEFERISDEAKEEKLQADSILSAARGKVEVMTKMIEMRLDDVIQRENTVEFNRQGLVQITKNQSIREQILNEKEKRINDRYNVLMRVEKGRQI